MERAAEHGVDWWTWRVVLANEIPDGLAELRTTWTFSDLYEAHVVLDTLEALRPEPGGEKR